MPSQGVDLTGLGQVALAALRGATSYSLSAAAGNRELVDTIAGVMCADENPGVELQTLSAAERALWRQRATSAMRALAKATGALAPGGGG